MPTPSICDQRAYNHLKDHLPLLEESEGLLAGAIAVAMHAFDDCHPPHIVGQLDALAREVRARVHATDATTLISHLHDELFQRRGFGGDMALCQHPCAAMLPFVLARGHGLPVVLCLAYKLIGERLGLRIEGIGLARHFLVRVHEGDQSCLIDPFAGGRLVTAREALAKRCWWSRSPFREQPGVSSSSELKPATHRAWLSRLMQDLQELHWSGGYMQDWRAIQELHELLGEAQRIHLSPNEGRGSASA